MGREVVRSGVPSPAFWLLKFIRIEPADLCLATHPRSQQYLPHAVDIVCSMFLSAVFPCAPPHSHSHWSWLSFLAGERQCTFGQAILSVTRNPGRAYLPRSRESGSSKGLDNDDT